MNHAQPLTLADMVTHCRNVPALRSELFQLSRTNAGINPWSEKILGAVIPDMESRMAKKFKVALGDLRDLARDLRDAFRNDQV